MSDLLKLLYSIFEVNKDWLFSLIEESVMISSAMKFNMEKLWQVKMQALLVQQGLAETLERVNSLPLPNTMSK